MSDTFATCCLTMLVTGLGCNPQINYFLSSCVLFISDGIRRAFRPLLLFYAGKMGAVLLLCLLTSMLGRIVLLDVLAAYAQWVSVLLNLSFIAVGIVTIIKTHCQTKKPCSGKCCQERSRFYTLTPVAVGALYGITPCAPFLMLLGYAAALHPVESAVVSVIFTAANAVSPIILLAAMTGFLSGKLYRKLPSLAGTVKCLASAVLIVIGVVRIAVLLPGVLA